MHDRAQKVKDLMEGLQSLKRHMVFQPMRLPRPVKKGVFNGVRAHHITPSQWGVLTLIEHRGQSTVKDAAKEMSVTSSAATQLVDGLVRGGYVVKTIDPTDRRKLTLTLSRRTHTQVDKIKKQVLKNLLKLFQGLSDTELDQFILLNQKIVVRFLKK